MTTAYAVFANKDYATQLSYFGIVLGIGMVEATIWYTNRLGHGISHVIGYIGANTLPIYLFHPISTLLPGRGMAMLVASIWLAPIVYAMV